jgi:hypothetical protein
MTSQQETAQQATNATQEVANRFYELAKEGKYDQIQEELFSPEAKSIEPEHAATPFVEGIDHIRTKAQQWKDMTDELHGVYCTEPIVVGNFFACTMGMDLTMKGQERSKMDEIAVYEVRDGKIVMEQFFY